MVATTISALSYAAFCSKPAVIFNQTCEAEVIT
jgi:hypothetical protein